ncbi:DedA family protein [Hyphomicrobium sp. 2TAF46]|uniref:DedA family protein n=1 Tax=Hyphomicrobium sp. 2TAF46 TaxID=3233019 RepID=UPI003F902DD6
MIGLFAELDRYTVPARELMQQAGHWIILITFALAFVKSLPFVPLLVPGTAVLLGIGFVVARGGLEIVPIWVAISTGAALGDWVSYWLGLHFAHAVRESRLAARYPEVLPRGEAFFAQWGALSIVLCRFFGPLRATVPFIAGVCNLPFAMFQLANWSSAFLWSAALLTPGVVATLYLSGP